MSLNVGYLKAKTDKASDEVYTPIAAITPLLKYINNFLEYTYAGPAPPPKKLLTIWTPFDEPDSNYVKVFRDAGYNVIQSHINDGRNFFYWEPEQKYDLIISNPPFSIKDDVLKRLYELDKPYAMLLPIPVLQGQKRFEYIRDCEALIFDKRINYYKDKSMKEVQKGVSFGSLYLCRKFLQCDSLIARKNLIFEKLENL